MAAAIRYNEWMATLPERLHTVPITQLAIPGSHDSVTSDLDSSLGVAVDEKMSIQWLGMVPLVKTVIRRWSKAQNLSVLEQLEAGIRYFDFRIAASLNTKKVRFLHGLYDRGVVKDTLDIINKFLEDNAKEIVILDFNHFFNMSGEHMQLLTTDIKDVFGSRLVPRRQEPITLEQLWETPNRVIVIYRDDKNRIEIENEIRNEIEIWPGDKIKQLWPNKNKSDEMLQYLDEKYSEPQDHNKFYVWQGVLTPRDKDIVLHPFSSLESHLSNKATEKFVTWMANKKEGHEVINVCIADFVEKHNYIPTVIRLNEKMPSESDKE